MFSFLDIPISTIENTFFPRIPSAPAPVPAPVPVQALPPTSLRIIEDPLYSATIRPEPIAVYNPPPSLALPSNIQYDTNNTFNSSSAFTTNNNISNISNTTSNTSNFLTTSNTSNFLTTNTTINQFDPQNLVAQTTNLSNRQIWC